MSRIEEINEELTIINEMVIDNYRDAEIYNPQNLNDIEEYFQGVRKVLKEREIRRFALQTELLTLTARQDQIGPLVNNLRRAHVQNLEYIDRTLLQLIEVAEIRYELNQRNFDLNPVLTMVGENVNIENIRQDINATVAHLIIRIENEYIENLLNGREIDANNIFRGLYATRQAFLQAEILPREEFLIEILTNHLERYLINFDRDTLIRLRDIVTANVVNFEPRMADDATGLIRARVTYERVIRDIINNHIAQRFGEQIPTYPQQTTVIERTTETGEQIRRTIQTIRSSSSIVRDRIATLNNDARNLTNTDTLGNEINQQTTPKVSTPPIANAQQPQHQVDWNQRRLNITGNPNYQLIPAYIRRPLETIMRVGDFNENPDALGAVHGLLQNNALIGVLNNNRYDQGLRNDLAHYLAEHPVINRTNQNEVVTFRRQAQTYLNEQRINVEVAASNPLRQETNTPSMSNVQQQRPNETVRLDPRRLQMFQEPQESSTSVHTNTSNTQQRRPNQSFANLIANTRVISPMPVRGAQQPVAPTTPATNVNPVAQRRGPTRRRPQGTQNQGFETPNL